jgi:hypothetical protein
MAAPDPMPEVIVGPDYALIWVLGGLAIAGLLALVAVKLFKRAKMRPAAEPPPPPPRPAHEVALEKLAALGDPKEEALKEFFTAISEILREYAGGRYRFDSLELTVDELMDALAARKTEGLDRERLRNLLVRADLVKFAKYRPTVAEGKESFELARAIVEATKEVVEG